jgi:tetratricopeptide (TPR) repeat protein
MKKIKRFLAYLLIFALCISAAPALAQQDELERAKELVQQVLTLYRQGRYDEAIPVAQNILAIREKALGPEHPETASSLNILARLYMSKGDYARAEPLYQRTLAIREKALGPEHPDTAASLNNLAVLYKSTGEYARAEPMSQRALAICEKVLGPEHRHTAFSLNNLASLYCAMGDYARAEPLYQRALAIREKALGPDHPSTATSLNNLADLYRAVGDYARAEPLCQRALAIREKALGPDHPSTAASLNNLAELYRAMGDYVRAEPLCQRTLAICEKALGPRHPHTATSLNNLAGLYRAMGDYARAEPLYQRALAICEKALGPEHPFTATSLNNLAELYYVMGDYARAESQYQRALATREKALGPEHPHTAGGLNNLAVLYMTIGDYARAEPLYQRALAIREKTLGPNHPSTAISLNSLALLYMSMGDYARAEPLYQRALTIKERALGPEHSGTAVSLNNLALLYMSMGDYARAEPLYKRALTITEKGLGPEHPQTAASLRNLAALHAARGEFALAQELHLRAQLISARLIDQVMGFTSEDQKMKFLATQRWGFEAALSLVAFHLAEDDQAVRDIFDVWLGRKGVILEAQRRYQEALVYSDNPEARKVFQELAGVRSRLSRFIFGGPGPDGTAVYRKKIAELEAMEKELEARLSKISQAFARQRQVKRADTKTVAQSLPRGAVLVDFAQISRIDFQAKDRVKKWGAAHYLAFILSAGDLGRVTLLDLGEAEPIDRAVAELKAAIADHQDRVGKKAMAAGEKLYNLVFAKLEKVIGEARDIFISPDGNLNLIPFEVLRTPDGKYLIEEYSFNYLASGRDMIGFGMLQGKPGPPLLMGDPDFSLDGIDKEKIKQELGLENERAVLTARRSPELRGIRFSPLPGTGEEVEAIRDILGSDSKLFTGKKALEDVLMSQNEPPRILHLATHGFFLTDQQINAATDHRALQIDAAPVPAEMRIENPLLRSGLALAGANEALESDNPEGRDGLFTAEEVLGLRLHGTDLVVLSACNTGVGKVKAGEGVYGLRRAFVQAGTKGLVMSMWPVPDQETKELMVLFYRNIQVGKMNRSQALRRAALKQMQVVKERYGHTNPLFWGAFVYLGEP